MERKVYRKPPVQEALCEIGVVNSPWDPGLVGRFYERVKGELNGDASQEATIQAIATDIGEVINVPVVRYRFQDTTPRRVAIIQASTISANVVGDYRGWEEDFQPFASYVLKSYIEESNDIPVERVTVRFINSIKLSTEGAALSDYIPNLPPLPPPTIPVSVLNIVQQSKLVSSAEQAMLDIGFGVGGSSDDTSLVNVMLDMVCPHWVGHS